MAELVQLVKDQFNGIASEAMLIRMEDRRMERRLGIERRSGREYRAAVRWEAQRRINTRRATDHQ